MNNMEKMLTTMFLVSIAVISFSSCKEKEENKVFYYDTVKEQKEADNYFSSHIRKVEFEGHHYLFFRDGWKEEGERTAAFVHDPNCITCKKEENKIDSVIFINEE